MRGLTEVNSQKNKKKWRNTGLYALLFTVVIALGTVSFHKQLLAQETWGYSRFLEEVNKNNVTQVKLSADRQTATVKAKNGDQVFVKLVEDPTLINKLSEKNIDVSVTSQTDEGFLSKALSSLLSPVLLRILLPALLLVGLLFLLLSRS
jgi:cell division protease FtsH